MKKEMYTIPFMVVISGQKCSLFCKNCANFSPYQKKDLAFYDIKKIIKDLKKITKNTKIELLQIQGGEFFLHKNADKLLSYVNKNKKIQKAFVATNATVMPNKKCLKQLENKKIQVRISDYGAVNEKSSEKLAAFLKENNIDFWHHKYANGNSMWSNCGGKEFTRLPDERAKENYLSCIFNHCLTLENGLIGRCSRATVAHNVQNFVPPETDFVNVRSKNFKTADLMNYFAIHKTGGGIVTACFYCNGTSGKSIPAGEQLTPEEIAEIRKNQ